MSKTQIQIKISKYYKADNAPYIIHLVLQIYSNKQTKHFFFINL